jgi:hypothetical protein
MTDVAFPGLAVIGCIRRGVFCWALVVVPFDLLVGDYPVWIGAAD